MTAEQLEELLGKVTQGEWCVEQYGETVTTTSGQLIPYWFDSWERSERFVPEECRESNLQLIAIAPSLARRVLAAEKLAEAVEYDLSCWPETMASSLRQSLTAYREASK